MAVDLVCRRRCHRRTAAGFSLLEALIAAAILLFIALGLIPIFARAIRDNATGSDSTQATNHGKTELEECLQLPFKNQKLAIAGAAVVGTTTENWIRSTPTQMGDGNEGWTASAPTGSQQLLWTRTTRVRQYNISDLEDDGSLTTPLPGSTQETFIHLKEIEVELDGDRGLALGGGRRVTFRVLKSI
jgi:Tfp pilus assembly protein PilV